MIVIFWEPEINKMKKKKYSFAWFDNSQSCLSSLIRGFNSIGFSSCNWIFLFYLFISISFCWLKIKEIKSHFSCSNNKCMTNLSWISIKMNSKFTIILFWICLFIKIQSYSNFKSIWIFFLKKNFKHFN